MATDAFGLGVDVPNLKFVLHVCMPMTIDNNVQKGGRAGREPTEIGVSHQFIFPQRYVRQYVLVCEDSEVGSCEDSEVAFALVRELNLSTEKKGHATPRHATPFSCTDTPSGSRQGTAANPPGVPRPSYRRRC